MRSRAELAETITLAWDLQALTDDRVPIVPMAEAAAEAVWHELAQDERLAKLSDRATATAGLWPLAAGQRVRAMLNAGLGPAPMKDRAERPQRITVEIDYQDHTLGLVIHHPAEVPGIDVAQPDEVLVRAWGEDTAIASYPLPVEVTVTARGLPGDDGRTVEFSLIERAPGDGRRAEGT